MSGEQTTFYHHVNLRYPFELTPEEDNAWLRYKAAMDGIASLRYDQDYLAHRCRGCHRIWQWSFWAFVSLRNVSKPDWTQSLFWRFVSYFVPSYQKVIRDVDPANCKANFSLSAIRRMYVEASTLIYMYEPIQCPYCLDLSDGEKNFVPIQPKSKYPAVKSATKN